MESVVDQSHSSTSSGDEGVDDPLPIPRKRGRSARSGILAKISRPKTARAPPKRLRAARAAAADALPTEPQFEIARLKDRLNRAERQSAELKAENDALRRQLEASKASEASARQRAARTGEVEAELAKAREDKERGVRELATATCELAHVKAMVEEERARSCEHQERARRADASLRELQRQLHSQQRELEALRMARPAEAAQQVQNE